MAGPGVMALVAGREEVRAKGYPPAVQLDIIRGRVRVGFTKTQVQLAHFGGLGDKGEPQRKSSEETAAGVVETWSYPEGVYTFTAGKVSKINKVE